MRFWSGASAIAGALRKHVWIDQDQFRWTPGMFVIFVAPPGVVTKSTTADLSMNLLREVPGVRFGPNNITWQALATSFAAASESFQHGDLWIPMSAITLVARELGSLINPKDQDLINLFIELWDGDKKYEKATKMSGNDTIDSPWINLLGATTPSWISDNTPKSFVGGGFASRCVFLYADEKERFVPYPKLNVRAGHGETRLRLIQDLEHIALNLVGEYELTPAAYTWGSEWYVHLWKNAKENYSDDQIMGYAARKQTHLHKLAMILAASQRDELCITDTDLQLADQMLLSTELNIHKVFAGIGRTDDSLAADRFIELVRRKGPILYSEAYRSVHQYFPDAKLFEGVLKGAISAGFLVLVSKPDGFYLEATNVVPLVKEAGV